MWTKSACVVLAWSILVILLVAGGINGSARPAQASNRMARSTTQVTLASTLRAAPAAATTAAPAARYVVQPGDTLSGIAARFGLRGGWPALYAANRRVIGPDPDLLRPGAVLVLPGRSAPVRYTVVPGDSLAGIAAALGVRGGWPALYAANRRVIGPDPDVIRPGTVLTLVRPAAPRSSPGSSPAGTGPVRPRPPVPPPSAATGSGHRPAPGKGTPTAAGMPRWLTTMLLAAGLLIGAAFLAEPLLLLRRRRRQAARDGGHSLAGAGPEPGSAGQEPARVVLADYDRVVVTHSTPDGMVYVLRTPGEDPKAILRAARLVLPEGPYEELADQLGVPAGWPAG